MTLSIFTKKYDYLRELLIFYRKQSGLTQTNLADKLKKPQSYVSKYESGERRLDIIELLDVSDAIQFDIYDLIQKLKSYK